MTELNHSCSVISINKQKETNFKEKPLRCFNDLSLFKKILLLKGLVLVSSLL